MYKSPIETIIGEMKMQQEGEIFRAVQEVGVNVDKDELIKALQYDRGQYEKGYKDGIRELAEKLAIELTANYSDKYCHWIDDTIDQLVEEMGCNDG